MGSNPATPPIIPQHPPLIYKHSREILPEKGKSQGLNPTTFPDQDNDFSVDPHLENLFHLLKLGFLKISNFLKIFNSINMSEPSHHSTSMSDISDDFSSSFEGFSPEPEPVPAAAAAAAATESDELIDNFNIDEEFRKLPLEPPATGQSFGDLESLILAVNEHATPRGYAVTLLRTKVSKLKEKRKAWLCCDHGRKIREPRGQHRKNSTSRSNQCPFLAVATREHTSVIRGTVP